MGPLRRLFLNPTALLTNSTTAVFIPGTLWLPAGGIVYARSQWEVFAVVGNAVCLPAYQVATSTDTPGASMTIEPTGGAAFSSAVDVYYPTDFHNLRTDGTAPLKSNMLVRFGWLVKLSSGSTLAYIYAGGLVETTESS